MPGPEGEPWFLALTNGVLQPVPQVEWYIAHDRSGDDGPYVTCQPGSARLFDGLRGDAS